MPAYCPLRPQIFVPEWRRSTVWCTASSLTSGVDRLLLKSLVEGAYGSWTGLFVCDQISAQHAANKDFTSIARRVENDGSLSIKGRSFMIVARYVCQNWCIRVREQGTRWARC